MNLQSIDDKLVTNILKYANYTTINRLRKLNERINKFAKESNWLRAKFIQEERRLFDFLNSGNNDDTTPKIHTIPTSGGVFLSVIYRPLKHGDWEKANRLDQFSFPQGPSICWESVLQTPDIRYVLGAFDLYENLLGAVYTLRDLTGSRSAEELERMEANTRNLIEGKYCSYIVFVAVHQKYRRYGLASELLRRTIEESKQSGDELIYLHTEQNNQPARRCYEKIGFINKAVLENFYWTGKEGRENGILYVTRHKENTKLVNENSSKEQENAIQDNPKAPEKNSEENPEKHPDQCNEYGFLTETLKTSLKIECENIM